MRVDSESEKVVLQIRQRKSPKVVRETDGFYLICSYNIMSIIPTFPRVIFSLVPTCTSHGRTISHNPTSTSSHI